ncbi:hypothetical protein BZA05DRAFT_388749 [Tricharina praecox]|uniref:uncharacterized protein n=1 Tax=Tricharina praecox TaxID=43433 RepID=UPI0022209149|nr:uncharacterized protein BZA05DRAFT_388749 [Tricharina praecox]KAI5856500.1 hypothetical protein BZA05DRAFT_388749 [Tricharina praecox]
MKRRAADGWAGQVGGCIEYYWIWDWIGYLRVWGLGAGGLVVGNAENHQEYKESFVVVCNFFCLFCSVCLFGCLAVVELD